MTRGIPVAWLQLGREPLRLLVGVAGVAFAVILVFMQLGFRSSMYAVAEVYETDVGRVRVGQRARVSSPAFERALAGSVERIGLRIGRLDVLGTDPVADTDARVVEVEVQLDEPEPAARFTNLRVDVLFEP